MNNDITNVLDALNLSSHDYILYGKDKAKII